VPFHPAFYAIFYKYVYKPFHRTECRSILRFMPSFTSMSLETGNALLVAQIERKHPPPAPTRCPIAATATTALHNPPSCVSYPRSAFLAPRRRCSAELAADGGALPLSRAAKKAQGTRAAFSARLTGISRLA
jgi:hypothetical protein